MLRRDSRNHASMIFSFSYENRLFHPVVVAVPARKGLRKTTDSEHLHRGTGHWKLSRRSSLQVIDAERSSGSEGLQNKVGRQRIHDQRAQLPRQSSASK